VEHLIQINDMQPMELPEQCPNKTEANQDRTAPETESDVKPGDGLRGSVRAGLGQEKPVK
jgi:hypothetical protein